MPTKREAFPSRFFKAADIPDNGLLLKIAKVEREKVGLDQELKWVVYFKGREKRAGSERYQLGSNSSRLKRRGQ